MCYECERGPRKPAGPVARDRAIHEHARLLLMLSTLSREDGEFSYFIQGMREEFIDLRMSDIMRIYVAYRGTLSERIPPYLDVETGRRTERGI